ncbi:MAG: methylated-DNA--[protein]-cysteine S-methyltransferase [Rhodoferax sp.]|uniref:methylated-DNA--[protein]-cysteine S-methyltransferase n=1 Tax=Rhodoferax sp. TaxID=50421 RepID=UPI0026135F80|nr:methylated-DNA--[protein]-cysteine S-methyltransferase [Rhodoferax sp.]MDD2881698.1 methylated-DNA--[protein]-cysteine S-methyltransferase [Rhodoferax sp.]
MKLPAHTQITSMASPLGRITMAAADQSLVGVWFEGQAHLPDLSGFAQAPTHPVLQQAAAQLTQYFAGERTSFELPLDLSTGTAFQQSVWQALLAIAPGQTCSYQTLSALIGNPAAVRAVGGAVGRNPLSIIVPCHRVVGAKGALTGYAGGLERKAALLQLEGAR